MSVIVPSSKMFTFFNHILNNALSKSELRRLTFPPIFFSFARLYRSSNLHLYFPRCLVEWTTRASRKEYGNFLVSTFGVSSKFWWYTRGIHAYHFRLMHIYSLPHRFHPYFCFFYVHTVIASAENNWGLKREQFFFCFMRFQGICPHSRNIFRNTPTLRPKALRCVPQISGRDLHVSKEVTEQPSNSARVKSRKTPSSE